MFYILEVKQNTMGWMSIGQLYQQVTEIHEQEHSGLGDSTWYMSKCL
jgi:hypothetical protein